MADMSELAAKMKVLSDAYAAQLPEKFSQLEQVWNKLPRESWDEEEFQKLHRMVHSLTGSGKTFGFSALSDVARNLENDLKLFVQAKIALNEKQRNHIESLISELRQVAISADASSGDMGGRVAVAPRNQSEDSIRRIYIVEDDVSFAENLKNQLSYFDYDVSVFNTLADFKTALQKNDAAVVLMDISFPEDSWGGVHVMQEVQQKRDVPLPVIFLSSHDELDARLEAVRAGGMAYFNKQLNLSSLIDRLDALTSNQPSVSYRVLIVDDSPSLTAYYAAVLEQAGMTTISINDPLAAMKPLLEFEPDLILIDMYMPGCNGMELAKVIRQLDAFVSIPIVFLSAEKDIDKQLAAIDLGGDDFLTKPIQPQHLVASVTSRIRRSLMLRSFMVRDSLTGLLNHTAIKDQLNREVARAKRQGTHCCFAMVDIDFFKTVNDTYGHPAGDRVIKSLSRLLKQRLREIDAVGRYGGEEFAVILADTDSATAAKVLDKIREDFSRLRHMADGTKFSTTFSCGIADVADLSDPTKLGDAADKALYKAKHGGRNQVAIADADPI
ncbi:MAG: response regulator [Gallionellaceae bacterium]|nr:MAG: response regulator [Gallionellaceae bacterium]